MHKSIAPVPSPNTTQLPDSSLQRLVQDLHDITARINESVTSLGMQLQPVSVDRPNVASNAKAENIFTDIDRSPLELELYQILENLRTISTSVPEIARRLVL